MRCAGRNGQRTIFDGITIAHPSDVRRRNGFWHEVEPALHKIVFAVTCSYRPIVYYPISVSPLPIRSRRLAGWLDVWLMGL